MKERYPFLAYWMKIGIKNFPKLTDDPEIFNSFLFKHIENHPEVFKKPALECFRRTQQEIAKKNNNEQASPPRHQELLEEEAWETLILPGVMDALWDSIKRMCEKHNQNNLDLIHKTYKEILYKGMTANETAEQLGRNLLSKYQAKGGKVFKTEFHREIIKLMYREMRNAITEIRKAIQANCTQRNGEWDGHDNDQSEQILIDKPDCLDLFDKKELPNITKNLSISDCAILIISKRLKTYLPPQSHGTTPLKRLLQK